MFDSLDEIGAVVGAGALSYFAAGRKKDGSAPTLRMSLDKSGSLVGDVRFLGGVACAAASRMKGLSGSTRKTLETVATASMASLVSTEAVRYQLMKNQVIPDSGFVMFPKRDAGAAYGGTRSASWATN